MCRSWSSGHEFLLCQWDCVKEGLHRGLAEAPTALMRSTIVVFDQPGVEISLQLVDCVIDLFAERDPVKLVQDSAMEALANAIGLRALGSWCGCGRCPRPRDRARIRGFGCRKARCRDRSAPATDGWRARHKTVPTDR